MNLTPLYQTNLYGLGDYLHNFVRLHRNGILPNKILLSGDEGIGKSTLAYHLINHILSRNEEFEYDLKNFKINPENKTYKLIINGSHPNFILIDTLSDKKNIDISQIRELILNLNKSTFNNKERFIIIDNIEKLNLNSINALLKILEEPPMNTYFILIKNNRSILPTLKSRCINFQVFLNHDKKIDIINKLLGGDISKYINNDLLNYYLTPGKLIKFFDFFVSNNYDLKDYKIEDLLRLIIKENLYKKNLTIRNMAFEYFEFFFRKKISSIELKTLDFYSHFIKKIDDIKKFNLDEESIFIEFEHKALNG